MIKIRLFCAAGMSTSLLVTKMQEYASKINYDCDIIAYPISEVSKYGHDADYVLLGPQVKYELNNAKRILGADKPVEAIDMRAYGMMDGAAVIRQVIEGLEKR
ncbi:MAG: PTS sugar transporter subunit IIB [Erysipelotrichaceae bacterium]|nr:PTS sugar transporter subunit IIB [Erysipelotrichaceae bacterium]MDY5252762.1 PTS sugar transporter subunit IIB [Erysipelotrichaceae bacterium]